MFKLTTDNCKLYAAANYCNTSCLTEDEFRRDLGIPRRISQELLKVLSDDPKGNIRLVVNLVVIFFNVFKPEAARNLLFFLVNQEYHSQIKSLLVALERADAYEYRAIPDCNTITQRIKQEYGL